MIVAGNLLHDNRQDAIADVREKETSSIPATAPLLNLHQHAANFHNATIKHEWEKLTPNELQAHSIYLANTVQRSHLKAVEQQDQMEADASQRLGPTFRWINDKKDFPELIGAMENWRYRVSSSLKSTRTIQPDHLTNAAKVDARVRHEAAQVNG